MSIKLVCWHCGEGKHAEVSQPPQFAFEIAGWANDVGMLGVLDPAHSRSLVFCNEDCLKAETTKKGSIRLRARGAKEARPKK